MGLSSCRPPSCRHLSAEHVRFTLDRHKPLRCAREGIPFASTTVMKPISLGSELVALMGGSDGRQQRPRSPTAVKGRWQGPGPLLCSSLCAEDGEEPYLWQLQCAAGQGARQRRRQQGGRERAGEVVMGCGSWAERRSWAEGRSWAGVVRAAARQTAITTAE